MILILLMILYIGSDRNDLMGGLLQETKPMEHKIIDKKTKHSSDHGTKI